jgi:AcrR family transcriptional regulator
MEEQRVRGRPRQRGTLIWSGTTAPPGQAVRTPLNRERIVRAAIDIADREGLAALSMRGVAASLDAGTMSLYRHVPDKEDLIDLMVDEVYGEIELREDPSGDWKEVLCAVAVLTRRVLRRHAWFVSAAAVRPPIGPHALRHMEYTLRALDGRGLGFPQMLRIVGAVMSYVTGHVYQELAGDPARSRGVPEEEWTVTMQAYISEVIASGRYPTFARLVEAEVVETDPDGDFLFGLRCLLDGLARRTGALPEQSVTGKEAD